MQWADFLANEAATNSLSPEQTAAFVERLKTENSGKSEAKLASELNIGAAAFKKRMTKVYDKFAQSYPELANSESRGKLEKLRACLTAKYNGGQDFGVSAQSNAAQPTIKEIHQNIPPAVPFEKFVGREAELEKLHQQLQTSRQVAIVAVAGMGGVGKTELATQYAKQHLQNYQGGVCWLSAQGIDVGIQILRFAELKFKLIAPDDWELADRLRYCWQNWQKGDVLLVFDDVTDYKKQVQRYLPSESPRFKVLLTTRLGFDRTLPQLRLDVLKPLAAMKLLKSLVDRERLKSEPWVARKICKFLGYLPLALELVGRYLDTMPDLSLEKMLKRLEKKRLEHEAIAKANPLMRYEYGVAEAFALSWEQLDENAQDIGSSLSLYALADIPLYFETIEDDEQQEVWEKAIADLLELHLLQRQTRGIYQLHPLLRQFFQTKLDKSSNADEVKTVFVAQMVEIARQISERPTRDWIKKVAFFIPHLAEVADNLTAYISDEDLIFIFRGLGWFYQGQGLHEKAEPWLQECVKVIENRLSSKHYYFSVSLNNLANLYKDQGRYNEAESTYKQALELWKYLSVSSDIDFPIILDNLAGLYYFKGKYSDAELLYFQALEIFTSVLGNENLYVANTLNNLAVLYDIQQHYGKAETLYGQVLEMRKRLQGENHPDFAQSLNNLAAFYESQGHYIEAETLYRRALKLRKSLQGKNHPDFAQILNNLGHLHNSQERYSYAESLLKKALEIRKRLHGENHPDVAQSLNSLATVYMYTRRYDEAKPLLQKALELRKLLLPKNHPDIATSLNNLAGLYSSTGLYSKAEPLYLQALEILELTLGVGHSRTMTIRENYEIFIKKAYG